MQIGLDIDIEDINPSYRKYIRYLWKPTPENIRLANIKTEIIYGGAASGKSYFIIGQRTPLELLATPQRNFLIARQVGRTNSVSTFNEIRKGINRLPRALRKLFKINKSKGIITAPAGNQVVTVGLDDVEKVKSITPENGVFTDIIVEEATETELASFMQLEKRLRGNVRGVYEGFQKRIVLLFNPIHKTHWIYTKFFEGVFGDNQSEYISDNLIIKKTTYKDNIKNLTPDDVQRILGDKDDYYRQVYAYGNWGVLGNLVYKHWEVMDLRGITKEIRFNDYYNGLDFGYTAPDAFQRMATTHDAIYTLDEIYASGLSVSNLAGMIKSKIGDEVVRCDSEDPRMRNELRSHGVNAVAARKPPGSVAHGTYWLSKRKWIVNKTCRGLIHELTVQKYKEDAMGNVLFDGKGRPIVDSKYPNHATDGSRYALEPIIETSQGWNY